MYDIQGSFDFSFLECRGCGKVGEGVQGQTLEQEIARLKLQFAGTEGSKIETLSAMIEQAACETLYLKQLNQQAAVTGLVKIHPDNPCLQQVLPVSGEIARHSAALTNILDKLMKHLAADREDGDEGLDEYE